MKLISQQSEFESFLEDAQNAPFITVDTEFLRESTYYAKLCLVQIAYPGEETAAAIDVLSKDINLEPLLDIFCDHKIVKVFHAARQDLEIFYHDFGVLPKPFFDTQIAAMVDGFGDQVGYEKLVRAIAKGKIDKSSRFTDWSRRPLTKEQISYALADVTFLRDIYLYLNRELTKSGRIAWVQEEFDALLEPSLYETRPEEAYLRIRSRTSTPRFLAFARELASFRERYAQAKNLPRNRVFKDDALVEAASQRPKDKEALKKLRLWKGGVKAEIADGVIKAISTAEALPKSAYPEVSKRKDESAIAESIIELLRVYLKAQAERNDVAMRLICNMSELEDFVRDPDGEWALNKGWRKEIFGESAKALIRGDAGLIADGNYVKLVRKDEL